MVLETSEEPPGHDLPRARREGRFREQELLELRAGEETVEREEPNNIGLAAACRDQGLFSDQRTKDLSKEKKLRPRAMRPIAHEWDERTGWTVGRDQRLPNDRTNGAGAAKRLTKSVDATLAVYPDDPWVTMAHFTPKM